MARIAIPNPDVPFLNPNGTVSKPWMDWLSGVDRLRLIDLRDITQAATPANADTVRYSATSKSWTYGA